MDTVEKVLVIEDDDAFRKTLVRTLERENYEVEGVADGLKAIELADKKKFDIIVSDVRLKGAIDGIETVRRIKEANPSAMFRIIIMTGYSGEEAPVRAIKVGVDDYIYKPFKMESFLSSIRKNTKLLQFAKTEISADGHIQALRNKEEIYHYDLEKKFQDESSKLNLLFEASEGFTSPVRLDEVLVLIIDRIASLLKIDRCSLLLFNEDTEALSIVAHKGLPEDVSAGGHIKMGETISGWVLENREAILVNDIEKDPRFEKVNGEKYYTGSFMSVPIIYRNRAIGVINANNKVDKKPFNEEDFRFIKSLAQQSSIAIENARLYTSIQTMCFQVTSSLASIIDAKDHYTKNHSLRVAKYAEAIADELGLPRVDINNLILACQLHDLGKIGVNEEILTKSGELTDQEYAQIRTHPEKGAEMIRPLNFLKSLIDLVEQHHERYDGTGYPKGIKGENIILGARIITVADSFDAILTKRPYSDEQSIEFAIKELVQCKGTQFDPIVVDAFIRLLKDPDRKYKWEEVRKVK